MAKGPRWWSFRDDYRHLHCFDPARGGHRVSSVFRVAGSGIYWRCSRQMANKHEQCGRWIYVCSAQEMGRLLEIEVFPDEIKALEELERQGREPKKSAEILEYLGFRGA